MLGSSRSSRRLCNRLILCIVMLEATVRYCREEIELGRGLPDLLRKPLSEHLLREETAW
jgi:hypothetical protein